LQKAAKKAAFLLGCWTARRGAGKSRSRKKKREKKMEKHLEAE
jgi:hypothetical protein